MQKKGTELKKRLNKFLKYIEIGQAQFAEIVGLSKGFANNVGDSIREDSIKKISDKYPELNINWLKTGEGAMLKNGAIVSASQSAEFGELEKENEQMKIQISVLNERLLNQTALLRQKDETIAALKGTIEALTGSQPKKIYENEGYTSIPINAK